MSTLGFQVNVESKTTPSLVTASDTGTTATPVPRFTDNSSVVITLFTAFADGKKNDLDVTGITFERGSSYPFQHRGRSTCI